MLELRPKDHVYIAVKLLITEKYKEKSIKCNIIFIVSYTKVKMDIRRDKNYGN